MKPVCIAIDLDYTITHYLGEGDKFFPLLKSYGIPDDTLKDAYEKTKHDGGFTFPRFLIQLNKDLGGRLDPKTLATIQEENDRWFESAFAAYPDSIESLKKLNSKVPIIILTFGHPDFQNHKIETAKIPHTEVAVTPKKDGKPAILQGLLKKYGKPILFIDDKASEIDRIRDQGIGENEVITVHMKRPDSPYFNQEAKHRHREISSLGEIEI
jgi:FMN phosphatase YigB (HAD superfamily)